jgi:hypothetical protein
MVRSLAQIFQEQEMTDVGLEEAAVTCSYCEVYNEVWEGGEGGKGGEGGEGGAGNRTGISIEWW